MQHMPLSAAYLCEDCHCVGNCSEQCPACASSALLCLAGILNREQQPAETAHLSYTIVLNQKNPSIADNSSIAA
jgi:hypothetical protein